MSKNQQLDNNQKRMESKILSDESVIPDEELIFSIIGDKDLIWQQTMSYLYDNNMKYQKCGSTIKIGKAGYSGP